MARQRKRSVHGGGSVFQRKDGRWEAKFKVEETGKYKSLYAASEKEAYKKLQDAVFEQKKGTLATGPQQTVKQFLEYWLEDVEKPAVRLNTYVNNRVVVHKHLVPGLGHIKLQKLTASQLQSFYAKKLKEGTSVSRIVRFNAVLHKALDHARRIKLVGMNVTEDVELPRLERHEAHVLVPEQVQLLLQKADERGLDALIALAVVTGMRKGEILGLHWTDIDFARGTLQVSRTLNYFPHYGFVEGKPKTRASERSIMLPQFLVDLLRKHRASQLEARLKLGVAWVDRDLVFCSKNGDFVKYTTLLCQFYKLLEDAGLPRVRFHDLRHSAATILLSKRVSSQVVQELLGHDDISTTLGTYGHVLPSMQQDALDKMDDLYGRQP
jgi:integrase